MLARWLENEPKETLVCAVVSVISLVLSITGVLKGALPVDIAWVAIVLCGGPILVGAFKGVVFEHDIKADLLVAMALIASAATGEYFAAGEVALIMQIGSLLEDYTSGKAREGIEKLIRISPQTARVLRGGKVVLRGDGLRRIRCCKQACGRDDRRDHDHGYVLPQTHAVKSFRRPNYHFSRVSKRRPNVHTMVTCVVIVCNSTPAI